MRYRFRRVRVRAGGGGAAVGYADLPASGAFEEASKSGDLAMYEAKAAASRVRPALARTTA
jgi:hypothetical protein